PGDKEHEDLPIDAGSLTPPNSRGDYVGGDKNKNGLQDDGEQAVPRVKATLQNETAKPVGTATTDANGKYLFDNLDDGTYTVCFDIKNLPAAVAGYQVTKQNAGDVTSDDAADAPTACRNTPTPGRATHQDLIRDDAVLAPATR